jgi:hypothetical protein
MSKRYPGGILRKTPQTPSQTSAQGIWDMASVTQAVKENTWPIAGVPDPISKSLRFRSSASARLNRTFATPTSRRIWTWSGWVKKSATGSYYGLFSCAMSSTGYATFRFNGDAADTLHFSEAPSGGGYNFYINSTAVYRDPAAWYHIVLAVDTTQATASNRIKMYVNGVQITAFSTATYPSQNFDTNFNSAVAHNIGSNVYTGTPEQFFDGYMTEVYFIDGQQLTPSSFGNTNDQTGVWQPIAYTGTYGTNGFYLPFSNTASTTTLGYDFSGNSNNWTTNNISLTSGSTYDSMNDVPTQWIPYNTAGDTGALFRGNYCVLNPLANPVGTLANGNLQISTTTDSKVTTATMALPSTGQYYFEITATDYATGGGLALGLVNSPFLTTFPANGNYLGIGTYSGSYGNGTSVDTTNLTGADVTNDGDIWCIAIDVTNNKFWAGRSRSGTLVWADGVTPSVNGSGASTLSLPTGTLYPMIYRGGSYNEIYNFNFGQQPFAHTPPSGFKTLNTTNLSTPTIGATASTQAGKYFNPVLYTGNGTTNAITGVGFQPDFVWLKGRSDALFNGLYDAVRGAGSTKGLYSNDTVAEGAYFNFQNLVSFDSNGFTLGATVNTNNINLNAATFVGWNWKANGTGVTNTAGSITSTVSANTTAGFSIVTYTGTGANATVGHGLGVAPSMIIVKSRSNAIKWGVYHVSIGNTKMAYLNETSVPGTSSVYWNNTTPSSSVFTIGNGDEVGINGATYVAYCFAQVAGYSAFGSYVGNGVADGPFIFTGFRPRYFILKNITSAQSWSVQDTSRSPYNVSSAVLLPNSSSAELTGTDFIDIVSNGFKIRHSSSGNNNNNGDTYIYMAFAESPFKYSLAR